MTRPETVTPGEKSRTAEQSVSLDELSRQIAALRRDLHQHFLLQSAQHQVAVLGLYRELLADERYDDPRRLERAGFKGQSQFDEDGILTEIFRRIGTTNRTFVEFGVGDGLQNNTLYFLCQGWRGLWFEYKEAFFENIRRVFRSAIEAGRLTVLRQFLTRDNLNDAIGSAGFHGEIDLVSIDVDGNDYHLFEALSVVAPRVVVIEYNAKYRPPVEWIMEYDPDHVFDKTDYCGASLQSLTHLAERKGYRLVGCTMTGANAFYVRQDLLEDRFHPDASAANHYQPGRYYLARAFTSGMPTSYGPFIGADGERFA